MHRTIEERMLELENNLTEYQRDIDFLYSEIITHHGGRDKIGRTHKGKIHVALEETNRKIEKLNDDLIKNMRTAFLGFMWKGLAWMIGATSTILGLAWTIKRLLM